MSNIIETSLKQAVEIIKKNLSYTLVKEYDFVISSHFCDSVLKRHYTTYEIYEILNEVCQYHRHVFSEECSLMIRKGNTCLLISVAHDVLGSFRRLILKTVIDKRSLQYTGYSTKTLVLK